MIDLLRLRHAFPERHIIYFDSIDSTQRIAAASEPAPSSWPIASLPVRDATATPGLRTRQRHLLLFRPPPFACAHPRSRPSPPSKPSPRPPASPATCAGPTTSCSTIARPPHPGTTGQWHGHLTASVSTSTKPNSPKISVILPSPSASMPARAFAREDILLALFPAIDSLIAEDTENHPSPLYARFQPTSRTARDRRAAGRPHHRNHRGPRSRRLPHRPPGRWNRLP